MALGQFLQAIQDFDDIVQTSSTTILSKNDEDTQARALFLRAKCNRQLKNFEQSVQDFSKAYGIPPLDRFPTLFMERALAHDKNHKYNEALQDYSKFLATNPKAPHEQVYQAHFNRGLIFYEMGHFEDAIENFEAAIASSQDEDKETIANNQYYLGRSKEILGDSAGSMEHYEKCIMQSTNHYNANLRLANALFEQKQYEKAIVHYSTVITIDPKDYISLFNQGMCFRSVGDVAAAIECFKKVQDIQPHYYRVCVNFQFIING